MEHRRFLVGFGEQFKVPPIRGVGCELREVQRSRRQLAFFGRDLSFRFASFTHSPPNRIEGHGGPTRDEDSASSTGVSVCRTTEQR